MIININPRTASDSGLYNGPDWNTLSNTEGEDFLNDAEGEETPVSLVKPVGFDPPSGNGVNDLPGTGDAAWIEYTGIIGYGWGVEVGDVHTFSLAGLDNNKKYIIRMLGSSRKEGRIAEYNVTGKQPKTLDTFENVSQDVVFDELSPVEGILEVSFTAPETSSGRASFNALQLIEIAGPELTATQFRGGDALHLNGSGYSADPNGSTVTVSQAGGRGLWTSTVTTTGWDATTGAFSAVSDTILPDIPVAGSSSTPALLYGESTNISLPDPGA